MNTLLADALTITAAQRGRTRYDHYESFIVMCPDASSGEWFIYGSADGIFDEVQGPFSTDKGALHCAQHALAIICRRPVLVVRP